MNEIHVYPPPDGADVTDLLNAAIEKAMKDRVPVFLHPGIYNGQPITVPTSVDFSPVRDASSTNGDALFGTRVPPHAD